MGFPSDTRLLVLHGLRLKGFGEPPDVGAIVGVSADDVKKHVEALADEGLAVRRDSARLSGWSLTGDGRAEQERLLADELAASGFAEAVRDAYERFLALNTALLALCTDWQMTDESTINDHGDAAYDAEVIARLLSHHDSLLPILDALELTLDRYSHYRGRFANSLEKLGGGDQDWFTKPMIDSYHTVWFQLHEDLLNTLGIERAAEATRR